MKRVWLALLLGLGGSLGFPPAVRAGGEGGGDAPAPLVWLSAHVPMGGDPATLDEETEYRLRESESVQLEEFRGGQFDGVNGGRIAGAFVVVLAIMAVAGYGLFKLIEWVAGSSSEP